MDHLPKIRDPTVPFPPVLYYENDVLTYSGPFESFRDRKPERLGSKDHCRYVYTNFVQEWLFFGLLQEMFALYELPFDRADFVSHESSHARISTSDLHEYFVALIVQEHLRRQKGKMKGVDLEDNDDKAADGANYWIDAEPEKGRVLEWLRKAHDLLEGTKVILRNDVLPEMEHLDPAVWDSVILTAAALSQVTDTLFRWAAFNQDELHYPVDFKEFQLKSITDLRGDMECCPSERRLIEQLVGGRPQDIAFFSQIDRKENGGIHASCTRDECIAHHIGEGYQTRHATPDCTCEMVQYIVNSPPGQTSEPTKNSFISSGFAKKIGADRLYDSAQKMYDEFTREIPAITFEHGQIKSVAIPLTKTKTSSLLGMPVSGWTLVAVSHVWSDGLGNRVTNALPACQLTRLQGLVDGLYKESQHPVPFWIDTLMIPVTPENASADQRHMKTEALRNMEWVYKGASKVLVLDSGLYSLDTDGMTAEEVGARIMCSTWSRRLWTLQEGCGKDRTFFQFQDRTMSWPGLHGEVLQRTSISDWRDKSSRLPKKHPIRKLQKITGFKYNGMHTSIDISNSLNFTTEVDISNPKRQAKRVLDKRLFKAINPVWYNIRGFLEDMSLEWSGSELRGEALGRCMRAMYYRSCTKKEDEGLVLTSLLSAKPGSAAAVSTSQKENRLRDVFLQLEVVPVDILFTDQQRYDEPGHRWMPKSLLSLNASTAKPLQRSERLHHRTWNTSRKANVICRRAEDGLEIGIDGLRIQPRPCKLSAPFCFEHQSSYYRVHLRRPGMAEETLEREEADWVLIPDIVFAAQPPECRAVLVKVKTWHAHRRGAQTTFSDLANLTRITKEDWLSSPLPRIEVKPFEKQKLKAWDVLKDLGTVTKSAALEVMRNEDKWIVG